MRYFVDVMTGVPSIVFGLFIYTLLVVSHIGGDAVGWKGALALALLMIPIVVRSAEVVLLLVPSSLREAALALGCAALAGGARGWCCRPRPRVSSPARCSRSRAAPARRRRCCSRSEPRTSLTGNLGQPMNSLPTQIFSDLGQNTDQFVNRAWGAALTLVAMILLLNLIARAISRRSRLA